MYSGCADAHPERTDEQVMDVGRAITTMFRLGKHAMRTSLAEGHEALTGAGVGILVNLDLLAPCRVAQLAEHLYLDSSTVSRQVDQLVSRGLVERLTDPNDRRAIQLSPTPAGAEVLEHIAGQRCRLWRHTLSVFSDDELATLADFHRRLADQLETVVDAGAATSESRS